MSKELIRIETSSDLPYKCLGTVRKCSYDIRAKNPRSMTIGYNKQSNIWLLDSVKFLFFWFISSRVQGTFLISTHLCIIFLCREEYSKSEGWKAIAYSAVRHGALFRHRRLNCYVASGLNWICK